MTRMTVTGMGQVYSLNVISFASPVFMQINTAQTKTEAVHFPIKLAQPSLSLKVQFASPTDFQTFQAFVRNHQQQVCQDATQLLTFNWPDRSIVNNTGVIPRLKAGDMRANYAPLADFEVYLVDSLASQRTDIASLAANWNAIYGGLGVQGGVLDNAAAAQVGKLITGGANLFSTVAGAAGGAGILSGTGL